VKITTDAVRILTLFLLGGKPEIISKNGVKRRTQISEILERYYLTGTSTLLVRNDKDLLKINLYEADGFVVFPYVLQRFAPLIYLAETGKPILIISEGRTLMHALETYAYLSDHTNVQLVFSPAKLAEHLETWKTAKWFNDYKICLFDAGNWTLDGIAWQKNSLFTGKLNIHLVTPSDLLGTYERMNEATAERLAEKWMQESDVSEPSLEDVKKVAQIYLAMKATMQRTRSNAAYVLWCGQFAELFPKMCFALAKLADDGYPVGCWRGENLVPMLMLHRLSGKPVFTGEAFTHTGAQLRLRHCFAPGKMASCRYLLRNWRTVRGTVTGYCTLPKGPVTLVNYGMGDRMVVTTGNVVGCQDIGGRNCRITVSVVVPDEDVIHKLLARECAMVYGNYERQIRKLAAKLGISIL
jgi:hypothetical protein